MLKHSLILISALCLGGAAQAFELTRQSPQWDFSLATLAGQSMFLVDHCPQITPEFSDKIEGITSTLYYPALKVEQTRLSNIRKSMLNAYLAAHRDRQGLTDENFSAICSFFATNTPLIQLDNGLSVTSKLPARTR